jgi:hypothetical protein
LLQFIQELNVLMPVYYDKHINVNQMMFELSMYYFSIGL